MTSEQQERPLCWTCGTKMRTTGSGVYVCEGCGATSGIERAPQLSTPLEQLLAQQGLLGDKLFREFTMFCWNECLANALGETIQNERVKPDFSRYRDAPAISVSSLSLLMRFIESGPRRYMSLEEKRELIKERIEKVLANELEAHKVKFEWGWRGGRPDRGEPPVLRIVPADQ